jgi:Cellulose binding domain
VRGIEDPAAGQWFAEQARELIAHAVPAFPATTCQVSYSATKSLFGVFAAELRIRNTGATPINGWTLKWNFPGSEKVVRLVGGKVTQRADAVSVVSSTLTAKVKPNATVAVAFVGSGAKQRVEPWLFTLNGAACASS